MGAVTHGDAGRFGKYSTFAPEYKAWRGMTGRGQRRRAVADEWRGRGGYQAFLAHIGRKPSPEYQLDRTDNAKPYEPGNVRWATAIQQQRNKSTTVYLEARGERRCLEEWAEVVGLSSRRIGRRLKVGWTPEEAIFTPRIKSRERGLVERLPFSVSSHQG